jgi:hypothetical protein
MSLGDQRKFLETFEKKLARRSAAYRRYTGNRQHHNFTVSKAALEKGVKETLNVGLAGHKKKGELVNQVILKLEPHTLNVIASIATNVKRRGADLNSVVAVVVEEDKPHFFRAHFSATQQDNGKYRNIYKQVYTSYDKLLNTYAEVVSTTTEDVVGQSFGDKAKDYFNLEHFLFQGIAESQVKDAIIDSVRDIASIGEKDVLDWLERSNLDMRIVRNTATDTMEVFIGSKVLNSKEAVESRTRKADLTKRILPDVRKTVIDMGSLIPGMPGSDSFVDIKRKKLLKKVSQEFSTVKGAKVVIKENLTIQKKKTSTNKNGKRTTRSLATIALSKGAGGSATPKRRVKKGVASSPLRLIGLINEKLPGQVAKNMGSPRLNYRTGRFASSVKVVDVATTAKGFPSFGYTYQRDPYEVFESTSGTRFSSVERDPRSLIDTSIREIAAELALGRFFTRRV